MNLKYFLHSKPSASASLTLPKFSKSFFSISCRNNNSSDSLRILLTKAPDFVLSERYRMESLILYASISANTSVDRVSAKDGSSFETWFSFLRLGVGDFWTYNVLDFDYSSLIFWRVESDLSLLISCYNYSKDYVLNSTPSSDILPRTFSFS